MRFYRVVKRELTEGHSKTFLFKRNPSKMQGFIDYKLSLCHVATFSREFYQQNVFRLTTPGLICREPDYCVGDVRRKDGVSLIWTFMRNCGSQLP